MIIERGVSMKKLYKKLAVVFSLVLLGCSVIFLPNNVTFASDLKKIIQYHKM